MDVHSGDLYADWSSGVRKEPSFLLIHDMCGVCSDSSAEIDKLHGFPFIQEDAGGAYKFNLDVRS